MVEPEVTEIGEIEKELKKEIRAARVKALKKKIGEFGEAAGKGARRIEKGARKEFTSLQKALAKGTKQKRKEILQSRIARQKLLAGLRRGKEARPVNILRRVDDRIPNVLIKTRAEEIKPTFLGRGGLL